MQRPTSTSEICHFLPTVPVTDMVQLLLPEVNQENFRNNNPHFPKETFLKEPLDPLKVENDETNPWSVQDVAVFLKYCCPECNFNDLNLHLFADHAVENHTGAQILFPNENSEKHSKIANETTIEGNFIKKEICDSEEYMDTENSKDDVQKDAQNQIIMRTLFIKNSIGLQQK